MSKSNKGAKPNPTWARELMANAPFKLVIPKQAYQRTSREALTQQFNQAVRETIEQAALRDYGPNHPQAPQDDYYL